MTQVSINTRSKREALLNSRKEELEFGWELRLPDASETFGEEFKVRIRKLQLGEKAAYIGVSDAMAQRVYERTRDYAKLAQEKTSGKDMNQFELLEMLMEPGFEDVINTTCLAAFIDPPLVETEAELESNPDAWLISDFSYGDRLHVFITLQNPGSKEAKAMTRFRPESATDVGRVGTEPDTESAA